MGRQRREISLLQVAVPPYRTVLSQVGVSVPSTAVEAPPSAGVSIVFDSAPIVRASRAAPLGRNSAVGRSAILQAEVILAAALRELDSVRASIADCTAAVAIAHRHLGLGGAGDDQEAYFFKKNTMLFPLREFKLLSNIRKCDMVVVVVLIVLLFCSSLTCAHGVKAASGLYGERLFS